MKRISILATAFAAVLALAGTARADEGGVAYRHNLSVAYGTLTGNDLAAITANVIVPAVTFGDAEPENVSTPGAFNIAYGYNFSNRFSVGAVAGYNPNSYTLKSVSTGVEVKFNNRYFYVIPQATFRWVKKRDFAMYSSVGFGVDFQEETDESSAALAWQVCAVGLEYYIAHSNFGLFFELGAGTAGLFQVGVRTRF